MNIKHSFPAKICHQKAYTVNIHPSILFSSLSSIPELSVDMTVPSEAPPKQMEDTEALSWGGDQAEIITLRAGKVQPPPQPATSLRKARPR